MDAVPAHVPSYSLLVGGVQVTDQNKQDVLDDGKISYDLQNKTLSLQDTAVTAQAETGSGGGIFS